MKYASAAGLAVLALAGAAQAQPHTSGSVVRFQSQSVSAGIIHVGAAVNGVFRFTNISLTPVIVESVLCSCTRHMVAPAGAIAAGRTGEISVSAVVKKPGSFNIPITVKLAGITQPVTLVLTGKAAG